MRTTSYDLVQLQDAFWAKKRAGYTLVQLSLETGLALSTVQRVLQTGCGRQPNVELVAKALGVKKRKRAA